MNKSWLAAILLLGGCSLNPMLEKPSLPVADRYALTNRSNAADLGWHTLFRDVQLQHTIETALQHNRDLRVALLNVETVRAQYRIQHASAFPAIEGSASWSRQQLAESAATRGIQQQGAASINLSAYEIDLFGRVKSLSEAAYARYLASAAGARAAQITLVAAVANAWYSRQLATEQLQLSQQTLVDWQHSLQLARQLQTANQSSGLDVAQAEGQVASAEADVEANQRALLRAGNALRLLVGNVAPLSAAQSTLEQAPVVTQLPAGLPSDLLTRRPDIMQAEQTLIAANADIGAARAAFFPRITLTASLGQASPQLSQLFDGANQTWQFMPQITLPIFQGGRLQAELAVAKLKQSSALAEYEKSIQVAFREVSDGVAGNVTYRQQMAAQQRVVSSAQRRMQLSNQRYQAGLDNRLELLDAQRQYYSARQGLLTLRQAEIDNAITLYKALGGGLKP